VSSVEGGLRWADARVREVVDGATVDGVQIRRKDGPRSWPVHAYIRYTDTDGTLEALHREVAACVEEATETGSSVHLRLVTLRAGVVASSRSVYVPAPERTADEPDATDDSRAGAGASALVATNRDLRALLEVYARQQGQTVAHAMQGWASSMARAAELERESAELRAALVVAEQAQQADPVVQQALQSLVPQLPMLLASFAASKQIPQGGG